MWLRAALVALLGLSPIRFGDTIQAHGLFNPGASLRGIGLNTKDKPGGITTWAAPSVGPSGAKNWRLPILVFRRN